MNQPIEKIIKTGLPFMVLSNTSVAPTMIKKMIHQNTCTNRSTDGYCIRSNRPCPAKLFTVTFNH